MSDLEIPFQAVQEQVNNAIDIVVQLDRGPDGSRKVFSVMCLESKRREEYRLHEVATFEAEPIGPDRVVRGTHAVRPLPSSLATRLRLAGEAIPSGFTTEQTWQVG